MELKLPSIDNEFGKFPSHMRNVRNVFEFSFAPADQVAKRFRNNGDIMRAFDKALQTIMETSLPDEEKKILNKLLADEKDVVSFSQLARNSIIAL
ncbi:hypothetical protein DUT91_24690 [Phyllobacterium salinisoli]|uniref:Uncharacterized protein n=1 Tax=Phyllobacterium salinisoli TaxID=1899321 RepID=A0A368JW08_9HYPH|nr:hypothetical protein [Phyllobacterium salinisoli]RCS21358.1 hypothetical protein DUT91_24690 [Phyllobacterium salinisoli]